MLDRTLFITPAQVAQVRNETIGACKLCRGAGRVRRVEDGTLTFQDCECLRAYDLRTNLIVANVPPKYWSFELDEDTLDPLLREKNAEALLTILDYRDSLAHAAKTGISLFIYGNPGLGKTAFCCWLLKEALRAGFSAYHTTLQGLVDLGFFALRNEDAQTKLQQILTDIDFLMLDELEKVYLSRGGETEAMLQRIVNDRYVTNKPILATSNKARADIGYGSAVLDRFQERMLDVVLRGTSLRGRLGGNLRKQLKGQSQ